MDKSDKTAIWGIIVGLGAAVASVAAAFAFPAIAIATWRMVFMGAVFVVLISLLALLDLHGLRNLSKSIRVAIHTAVVGIFLSGSALSFIGMNAGEFVGRYSFTNPPEIWMEKPITVRSLFNNQTDHGVIIGKLAVLEILMNSKLYNPYQSIDMCLDPQTSNMVRIDAVNPNGSAPIKVDVGWGNLSSHALRVISVNGQAQTGDIVVAKDSASAVEATTDVYPPDWGHFNSVVLCPTIMIEDAFHGETVYVCKGIVDFRHPDTDKGNIVAMPTDIAQVTVDHNNVGVGEIMAWVNESLTLKTSGSSNCRIAGHS